MGGFFETSSLATVLQAEEVTGVSMDNEARHLKHQSWHAWKKTLDEALAKIEQGDIRGAKNVLEGARNIIDNALTRESA